MADLLNFSGGLQTTTSSFLRKENQLELSINVHFDNIGSITKRLGYSKYGDTVSSNNQILGLCSYPDISGGTTKLFSFSNGSIKYGSGGAVSTVVSGLDSDAKAEFRVFLDQLFMVGADSSNNYLSPANIDGTTYSTSTNLSGAPEGAKFVEVFQDQIYFANVKVSGTRHPSRFYYSSIPDSGGTTITWTSTDYESIYANNGEEITGLHANKSLNQLLIFKDSTMHAWDNYNIRDIGNVGTTSHRSIVTINFTTYFYRPRFGVYSYSGTQPQLISRPIEKWLKGISDPAVVHGGKEDEKYYKLYIGDTVVDGVTYTNCEARYSQPDNTWTIYSYFDNFTIYADHKVSGVIRPYAGAADGDIHQLAITGDTIYADDGNAIGAQFMTKALDLFRPNTKKFASQVMIYTTAAQNVTGRIRVRGKDWSTHFNINDVEQYQNVNPAQGRFHQFHFSENSSNPPFQFEGFSFDSINVSEYV